MQRSSQLNTKALNLVNNSHGTTPVWISTNQKIGDYQEEEGFDCDGDDEGNRDDHDDAKLVNNSPGTTQAWISTNQKIGDYQ